MTNFESLGSASSVEGSVNKQDIASGIINNVAGRFCPNALRELINEYEQ